MVKAVFDTNILIDYLNGVDAAQKEISYFDTKYISIISYIEIMVGVTDPSIASEVKSFLETFKILHLDEGVAELAVSVRKKYKMKIQDAIILGTAIHHGASLITRNIKDFSSDIPSVRVPYMI